MPSSDTETPNRPDQRSAQPPQHQGNFRPPWRVEGARQPREADDARRPPHKRPSLWAALALLLALDWFIVLAYQPSPVARVTVPYSYFVSQIQDSNVASVTAQGSAIQGTFRHRITYPARNGTATAYFRTNRPAFADDHLLTSLLKEGAVVNAKPLASGSNPLLTLLGGVLPTLLLVGFWLWIMQRYWGQGGGAGGMFGMGSSKAHKYEATQQRTTFADVAGIDEAKDELEEVVDFLKHPDRYRRLGAEIPRGLLLSGQPGTGKTLLARAVAGEADVPFYSISASEFVEMIVGVGASRVRDLFHQAKEAAPAIIFIDELDAIGRSRASGGPNLSGGHDEREQTLNQILTEMDGFSPRESVIVLGATNRPEILDQALLRPGRFDRRVVVVPPDRAGREAILDVHTRSVPLDTDVDLGAIASATPGMVGADLANVANEAALLAAKRDHSKVARQDITDALERIVLGAARKVMLSEDDRRRTAYHEAGHAIMGMLTPGADPVRKVSIIPRGMALGVTFSAPDADRFNFDERHLLAQIKVALGGRVAEEVVFGDLTTGAESDIQQLTRIARGMVGRWGMSRAVGPIAVLPADGQGPLLPGVSETSEQTQQLVDEEVRRIVETAHEEATVTLSAHRANLDALVSALLEHETLDQDAAYEAAGLPQNTQSLPEEAPPVVQSSGD